MHGSTKSSDAMKSTLYQHIARVAAALASESRLLLLEYVAQGERSVETLATMTGLSMANCSKHLQALRAAGLVHARREGLRVYYGLAGDDVVALYSALHHVAENRVAEVEKLVRTWLRHKDEMEPVHPAELLERVAKGLVVVIDVRPPRGVRRRPRARRDQRAHRRSSNRGWRNCRSARRWSRTAAVWYCLMSFDVVRTLRERGIKARRLEDGFPEWRAAGLPVER